jgi:hypothetical protein
MKEPIIMAFRPNSATRKVVDYLASGKTLTAAQADARFGIANFSATMSSIKETVEAYDNWKVTKDLTKAGSTKYGIQKVRQSRRS